MRGISGSSRSLLISAVAALASGFGNDVVDIPTPAPAKKRRHVRPVRRAMHRSRGGYIPAGPHKNVNQEGECARRVEQMKAGRLTSANGGPAHMNPGWMRHWKQSIKLAKNTEYGQLGGRFADGFRRAKEITDAGQEILRGMVDRASPTIELDTVEVYQNEMRRRGVMDPTKLSANIEILPFAIGEQVIWASNGVRKLGKITHVVEPGKLPADVGAKVKDAGAPRDHVSFIVSAIREDQDYVTAKPVNYWPRVSLLSKE